MLVVFVNQIDRDRELACSEGFAEFVAVELLPWIQSRYDLGTGPKRTIIGGSSLGGLMASYCAFRHSDKFGNVLSLSGAYHWLPSANETSAQSDLEPAWLTRQFLVARCLPIRFYLSAGRFEHRFPVSLLAENRHFRDVLEAKGYRVKYSEFSGGHDPVCWRSPFVDGLIALAGIDNGE